MLDIVIVTPALAQANNGNWQTAQRWARMLRSHYRVRLVRQWSGGNEDLMIALHARRSAASVAAWAASGPHRPLMVVLTGTDLYRDIAVDPAAQHSLDLAHSLVVLQPLGVQSVPPLHRHKVAVCIQSSPQWRTLPKTDRRLRALMVGHLRSEKSPQTWWDCAAALQGRNDIVLDHIGDELDPDLGDAARQCMAAYPRYRWLGALPHAKTRAHIQRAHVLVHASQIEGGAHVVIEAVTSGTPVLASRIDGNLGLLGDDYAGTFAWGDAQGLASLLQRCRDEPSMLAELATQCARRAHLFTPSHERETLTALVERLLPSAT